MRSLVLSDYIFDPICPYRYIHFYDADDRPMSNKFKLTSAYWPESYPKTTLTIPEGYELMGFAIKFNPDGTIINLGFSIWQPPKGEI